MRPFSTIKGIEAVINTTPNDVHLETTRQAAAAGKHVFLDKPIANSVSDGRKITEACRQAGVVLALGYQRRRESHFRWIKQQIDAGVFGKLVNAEANISRDRLGQFDLSSWRYTAAGMPGGVMLQIGIHYVDVLTFLIGPVKAVHGQSVRLVLPGDNPDVASLMLEHDNGALSTLNASYASASEYYLMNIYGKEATAYYDLHHGLSLLKRGEKQPVASLARRTTPSSRSWRSSRRQRAAARRRKSAATTGRPRLRSSAPASCRRAKAAASKSRKFWRRIERRYFLDSAIAAFRIGCHLAISALSTAVRCAGPRSALVGTAPPRSTMPLVERRIVERLVERAAELGDDVLSAFPSARTWRSRC